MKVYHNVCSSERPQDVEITANTVYVASNINAYELEADGHTMSGYRYDCTEYTKDEYLLAQSANIANLQEELSAAKILLGVD